MAKRDAEKAVRDIWAMKGQHDMGKKPEERIDMQEFFYIFCLKKFGAFQNMIAEWSYNVLAVLEGNRHDSDCDTFLKVLQGELSEDVYHDQHHQVEQANPEALGCDCTAPPRGTQAHGALTMHVLDHKCLAALRFLNTECPSLPQITDRDGEPRIPGTKV